jgi:hypothetical protein
MNQDVIIKNIHVLIQYSKPNKYDIQIHVH